MKLYARFILAAVILAAAGLAANAQISIQAGASVSHQKMTQHDPYDRDDRGGIGAYAGVDYGIHIIKGFHITPGLYYNFTHARHYQLGRYNLDERQADHQINIPVYLKYSFNLKPNKLDLYLYAGPVLSVGMASELAAHIDVSGFTYNLYIDNYSGAIRKLTLTNYNINEEREQALIDDFQPELDNRGITQRYIDLQIDGGIGFRFKDHWELRFGYSFGVFDRFNRAYGDTHDLQMTQYYVGFGYRF